MVQLKHAYKKPQAELDQFAHDGPTKMKLSCFFTIRQSVSNLLSPYNLQ